MAQQMIEAKKTIPPTTSATATQTLTRKSVVEFVGEVKQELKLVDWTAKDELKFYTKVVVGATFAFGMAIYVMDLVIQGILHLIGLLAR